MSIFSKVGSILKGSVNATLSFLKGKKRWLVIGLQLVARNFPDHTTVGQVSTLLANHSSDIIIGLDVVSGLFAASDIVGKTMKNTMIAKDFKTKLKGDIL